MPLLDYVFPVCTGFLAFVLGYLWLAVRSWKEDWSSLAFKAAQAVLAVLAAGLLTWGVMQLTGSELSLSTFAGLLALGSLAPAVITWWAYRQEPARLERADAPPPAAGQPTRSVQHAWAVPESSAPPDDAPPSDVAVRVTRLVLRPRRAAPVVPASSANIDAVAGGGRRRSFRKPGA